MVSPSSTVPSTSAEPSTSLVKPILVQTDVAKEVDIHPTSNNVANLPKSGDTVPSNAAQSTPRTDSVTTAPSQTLANSSSVIVCSSPQVSNATSSQELSAVQTLSNTHDTMALDPLTEGLDAFTTQRDKQTGEATPTPQLPQPSAVCTIPTSASTSIRDVRMKGTPTSSATDISAPLRNQPTAERDTMAGNTISRDEACRIELLRRFDVHWKGRVSVLHSERAHTPG